MCIQKLTAVCVEQRANYDPTYSTAFDDITMINQLDIHLVCLHMRVKFWEDKNKLLVPIDSKAETRTKKAVESSI